MLRTQPLFHVIEDLSTVALRADWRSLDDLVWLRYSNPWRTVLRVPSFVVYECPFLYQNDSVMLEVLINPLNHVLFFLH
jgi:hypothetical protein